MSSDFPKYKFITTSSDMFLAPEDIILQSEPVWHATALGWPASVDTFITKLPVISERFRGVHYQDIQNNIDILSYCAYLPTAGQDDLYTEILSLLTLDLSNHKNNKNSSIIIGMDSNCNIKSTKHALA